MISIWWLIAASIASFFVGAYLGMLLLAVMMSSKRRDENSGCDDAK